jgi:hypothetical protein
MTAEVKATQQYDVFFGFPGNLIKPNMGDIEDIRDTGDIWEGVYLCEGEGAVGIVLSEGEGVLCTRRASISVRVRASCVHGGHLSQ